MFKNFKDGSTAEVDVIMMCTGYLHSYPFLRFKLFCFCELTSYRSCSREELRMKCKNLFYPPGLYKVIKIWTNDNNIDVYVGYSELDCTTISLICVTLQR